MKQHRVESVMAFIQWTVLLWRWSTKSFSRPPSSLVSVVSLHEVAEPSLLSLGRLQINCYKGHKETKKPIPSTWRRHIPHWYHSYLCTLSMCQCWTWCEASVSFQQGCSPCRLETQRGNIVVFERFELTFAQRIHSRVTISSARIPSCLVGVHRLNQVAQSPLLSFVGLQQGH